tara:strand:+ start:658 stop:1359 length:702 start_codon:yes stop_codon:yes gene_type:complete
MKASSAAKVAMFKNHRNSTGHTHGVGCVGKTESCMRVCYVDGPVNQYPAVAVAMQRNLESLQNCKTANEYYCLLKPLVVDSLKQYENYLARLRKAHSKPTTEMRMLEKRGHIFRWNWSADILTMAHAEAINRIAEEMTTTTFWLYTRTWWIVGAFKQDANIAVYLSVDKDNEHIMRPLAERMNLPLAFMGMDEETFVCPATNGKLAAKLACVKCGYCYTKRNGSYRDVLFQIH